MGNNCELDEKEPSETPVREKKEDQIKSQEKADNPVTDFKIAEIWIRSGQIMIDAAENFWSDRCRALGVLEFCKDIVRTAQMPQKKIIPAKNNFLNGLRNLKLGRKK